MNNFDPARAVADFRAIFAKMEALPRLAPAEYKKLEAEAKRMREAWKAYNGDDELFEMAFGEPFDENGKAV